ncbi:hypothetical protein AAE478_008964 [Parahypoxylon ruwenzoriense]
MDDDLDKILNREHGFKYPPIDPAVQIRLLRIYPLVPCRRRQYSLGVFSLSELSSTRYRALSYTWGRATAAEDVRMVSIDGQSFFVRRNLSNFLNTVAGKGESGLFFIDAICINQLDGAERRSQVREMARVYRNASAVVAWLGIPGSEQLRDDVRALSQTRGTRNCADWTAQQWNGFRYLSYRPYWSRVWIVQEVLLAPRMAVWCGYFVFPLSLFAGVSSVTSLSPEVRFGEDGRPRTVVDAISRSCSPAEKIITHRTRQVLRPVRDPLAQGVIVGTLEEMTAGLTRRYAVAETYQSQVPDLIYEVVRKFGMLGCSDPRDKLYGFLGILKESSRAKVNPDYTKNVSDAYRQALKIGLEEISDEFSMVGDVNRTSEMEKESLAYYCDVRDAFGIADGESMEILKGVAAELRLQAQLTDPMVEVGWHRHLTSNDSIFVNLEKLIDVKPTREGQIELHNTGMSKRFRICRNSDILRKITSR